MEKSLKEAKSEGQKYFNDDRVYVEAFIPVAKHVEVQVIGDGKDNYVHLGERDCSVQRKIKNLLKNHHVLLYLKKEESKYVTTLLK